MKILYQGPMWRGSTSVQRAESLARQPGFETIILDSGGRVARLPSLYARVRWRLRWPVDSLSENDALIAAAKLHLPDAIVIDNSKVIRRNTLRRLLEIGVKCLAYYTPDDIMGAHNLSHWIRSGFPVWDVIFTTKTFNVPELASAGARNPVLIGKAFDAQVHRPMRPEEVGEEFERFDLVFIGTYEAERCASINALGQAGFSVVVYGEARSGWLSAALNARVELRPSVYGEDYVRALHHGRVALCFLRKLNRDRITQRTMEIAAAGRPMLAEKTDEHDAHFIDGREYAGFLDNEHLVRKANWLLSDETIRSQLGVEGRNRCLRSRYSSDDRAKDIVSHLIAVTGNPKGWPRRVQLYRAGAEE